MSDRERGLHAKYNVRRIDNEDIVWCFVLEDKDPLAVAALEAYAEEARRTGYSALARDLQVKVGELAQRHLLTNHRCGKSDICAAMHADMEDTRDEAVSRIEQ